MIQIPFSLSQLEYYLYHWIYFPDLFPHPYSLISLLVLFAIGLALMFKGNYSWNIVFGALGAYFGFILGHYITTFVTVQPVPDMLVYAAGAVIGAIVLIFMVRVFLSLSISYLAYIAIATLFPGDILTGGIVFLAVFLVSILLYHRIVMGIAGVLGAFITWFVLLHLGVSSFPAQVITVIMLILGLFLQYSESRSRHGRDGKIQPYGQDSKWKED